MELRKNIGSDVEVVWKNPETYEEAVAGLLMLGVQSSFEAKLKESSGRFPPVGEIVIINSLKFLVTKSEKKGFFTSGKSEIVVEYIGIDAAGQERMNQEWEEAQKPKGEIDEGLYSRVLERENLPRVRVSFVPNTKVVNSLNALKDTMKTLDFIADLLGSCIADYYSSYKSFPSTGDVLMNSSRTLYFEISKKYFMHPRFLEPNDLDLEEDAQLKKASKWSVGLLVKMEMCEKDPDILKSILNVMIANKQIGNESK
jgi:hypothetical protein